MIILVGYTSIEGQTRKIASAIAEQVEDRGHRAILFDVASMAEYALERPEAAILCAPVHGGRYPAPFFEFVRGERDWLNSVPSAFVSVSLMIVSDFTDERDEARHFADLLVAETGWTPREVAHVAGALRFTEYDFFKRWMVRRIAAKAPANEGAAGTADREFTDWREVALFVDGWLEKSMAYEP
ncbi:protoporphyrinogen oxidase [Rhizobiaceae bacterium BDR2-2]|uniref:Protoporphyrinogen oxidase n=1 Tax=Ectorhizobium quercum TaxID=2965071 RepID=A0AAE3MYS2_9HYPH|nr:flavodoxin domain-containing protein [Ectorhizobium quercum]MCX8997713.1 protoporphyrinogen oxidase [Ectorhizobium quercum]